MQEPPTHLEMAISATLLHREDAVPEQGHERRVPRQDTDLAIERRRDHRVGVAAKKRPLGGNDCDAHHAAASFFACSTTSSMAPTM